MDWSDEQMQIMDTRNPDHQPSARTKPKTTPAIPAPVCPICGFDLGEKVRKCARPNCDEMVHDSCPSVQQSDLDQLEGCCSLACRDLVKIRAENNPQEQLGTEETGEKVNEETADSPSSL